MDNGFDGRVIAGILDSGRVLAHASNAAAVLAGIGIVLAPSDAARLALALSMACWPAGCYFAVRVAMDASLFRALAAEPADGCRRLDELLRRWGWLNKETKERDMVERGRAAISLWRKQIAVLAIQLAALAVAGVMGAIGG